MVINCIFYCTLELFFSSFIFYRLQRSCGKLTFLHVSVILSTWEGAWQTPPGRHPLPPWTDTPPPPTPGQTHPVTTTAVDGMHPTGIHSCISENSVISRLTSKYFWTLHVIFRKKENPLYLFDSDLFVFTRFEALTVCNLNNSWTLEFPVRYLTEALSNYIFSTNAFPHKYNIEFPLLCEQM